MIDRGSGRRKKNLTSGRYLYRCVFAGGAPLQWRGLLMLMWTARILRAHDHERFGRSKLRPEEARGPEDHDAPLQWRAPSNEAYGLFGLTRPPPRRRISSSVMSSGDIGPAGSYHSATQVRAPMQSMRTTDRLKPARS